MKCKLQGPPRALTNGLLCLVGPRRPGTAASLHLVVGHFGLARYGTRCGRGGGIVVRFRHVRGVPVPIDIHFAGTVRAIGQAAGAAQGPHLEELERLAVEAAILRGGCGAAVALAAADGGDRSHHQAAFIDLQLVIRGHQDDEQQGEHKATAGGAGGGGEATRMDVSLSCGADTHMNTWNLSCRQ